MLNKTLLMLKVISYFLSYTVYDLKFRISTRIRRLNYQAGSNPKNIVVIGASFAGYALAKQLALSLPSGFKVILIEKNSHFHFTWNFPRSSVVSGHDHKAFIPYPDQIPSAPEGALVLKRGTVGSIKDKAVILDDGTEIEYEYLVIATGSHARYPAKLQATEKPECIKFFQDRQEEIKLAQHVVVVGGGAAGMEVASDTKSKYPEKDVTLVHSRDRLLNNFGPLLHEKAMEALESLGVKVYLNERVIAGMEEDSPKEIALQSGTTLRYDTLVRCTGQYPRGDLIKEFSPASISPSGKILVEKSLRVANSPNPNIFAAGDVAELSCPSLGRGASTQGIFVADNIVRSIRGKSLLPYKPSMMDHSIELTLGLGKNTSYISDGVREIAFAHKVPNDDLFAPRMWAFMGQKPYEDPSYDAETKVSEL